MADALSRRPDYSTLERSLLLLELTGDDDLLARIRSLAAADPTYQRVANAVQAGTRSDFVSDGGILYKIEQDGTTRLYVPSEGQEVQQHIRQMLLREAHDGPLSGHLGRDKTYRRLARG